MSTTSQHPANTSPWPPCPRSVQTPVVYRRQQLVKVTCTDGCTLHKPAVYTQVLAPHIAAHRDGDHIRQAMQA